MDSLLLSLSRTQERKKQKQAEDAIMSTEATTKDAVEDKANNDGHNEPKSGETSTTASQSNHSNKKENTENDPQTSTSPTQKEHKENNPTSPPSNHKYNQKSQQQTTHPRKLIQHIQNHTRQDLTEFTQITNRPVQRE